MIRKSDLLAQPFCDNAYFDSLYLHFEPFGCSQNDRLVFAGDSEVTGYYNTFLAVLSLIQLAQRKRKRIPDSLKINIIEEWLPIQDNGKVTNEGITKVGTILVKGKYKNWN